MRETFNFDKKDRELLRRINEVIDHGPATSEEQEAFNTSLHPHGIQNMVTTHEVRMAMAVINLLQRLNSIEGMNERLVRRLKHFMKKCFTALRRPLGSIPPAC